MSTLALSPLLFPFLHKTVSQEAQKFHAYKFQETEQPPIIRDTSLRGKKKINKWNECDLELEAGKRLNRVGPQ